jgi:tripartite-type tricarboxylate transporter receptor subunit TctC
MKTTLRNGLRAMVNEVNQPMSRFCRFHLFIAALGAVLPGISVSHAQDFPNRPIRIIVPYTAGGSSDYVARTIAAKLQENLKNPVVVENKPGGNAQIGCDYVAKSAPDGYTLLLAGMTTHAAAPALYKKLPYDTIKDFAPITNVIESPLVVVVNPGVHANTLKELVTLAKANPGTLNYGSAGVGNTLHLAGEMFRMTTGTDLVHVPYKGASQALGDLLGGRIQVMFDLPQTPLANIHAGRLRALAVTGSERLSLLPNVPTTAEAGVPAFTFGTWIGLVAPAGTPPAIINRLHAEIVKAATQADVKEAFAKMAMLVATNESPEAFAKKIQAETERLAKVIRAAGIQPE